LVGVSARLAVSADDFGLTLRKFAGNTCIAHCSSFVAHPVSFSAISAHRLASDVNVGACWAWIANRHGKLCPPGATQAFNADRSARGVLKQTRLARIAGSATSDVGELARVTVAAKRGTDEIAEFALRTGTTSSLTSVALEVTRDTLGTRGLAQ
jgi:hypothetical protein